jgi:hypothetical protein
MARITQKAYYISTVILLYIIILIRLLLGNKYHSSLIQCIYSSSSLPKLVRIIHYFQGEIPLQLIILLILTINTI